MDNPMEEPDKVAARAAELLREFADLLIKKYNVPPETVSKVAVATAVELFLHWNTDNVCAAANYLRGLADELDLCDLPPHRPNTVN